ncbi:hypothetical protein HMPREF3033_00971 [Veillonellaceae bacterium DNF00751]|nr:hypothetical protein HMPREF3033_00971 [Veillonellaceae bacterium DNF00751]
MAIILSLSCTVYMYKYSTGKKGSPSVAFFTGSVYNRREDSYRRRRISYEQEGGTDV